jgi:hypothetical protein
MLFVDSNNSLLVFRLCPSRNSSVNMEFALAILANKRVPLLIFAKNLIRKALVEHKGSNSFASFVN